MKKPRPIRVDGDVAYVPLTKGYEAVIDAEDVGLITQWCWHARVGSRGHVYAARGVTVGESVFALMMHRVICPAPTEMFVDHIDGDSLNNRKTNLRLATNQENLRNRGRPKNNTSGFKGVIFDPRTKMWCARITANNQTHWLGRHKTAEKAHAAYCAAIPVVHGEFGRAE